MTAAEAPVPLPLELRLVRPAIEPGPLIDVAAALAAGPSLDPSLTFVELQLAGSLVALPVEQKAIIRTLEKATGGRLPIGGLAALAAQPQPVPASLRVVREPWAGGRRDVLILNLPPGLPASAPGLMMSLGRIAQAFGAWTGGLYHPLHLQAVRLPAIDNDSVQPPPGAQVPRPPAGLPEAAAEVAAARPPTSFDTARIPEAVWWISYWGPMVLALWPKGVVTAAPWHRVHPCGEGLLLMASSSPPSPAAPNAFAEVAALTRVLGLQEKQRTAS